MKLRVDLNEFVRSLDYLDAIEIEKIQKAWKFANLAHTGQKRKSGDLYVTHCLETAKILSSWKLDATSIVSGLLHDTIEDGAASTDDIEKMFGQEVALLVDGVTKVSNVRLKEQKADITVENLRKLVLVMAKDLRVVLVKLADRLHNMRTLEYLSEDKRRKIARETLEIYAPLAERMGMGEVKGKLEDLSFKYLYPKEFEKLTKDAKKEYKRAADHIKKMKRVLLKDFAKNKIKVEIHGRKKHLYSLWRKLQREYIDWDFTKIHDIVALRILVDSKKDCYTALGFVHDHYRPIPNIGISDFIAQPKPNGYQSIHTKVFGPDKRAVEVQIRTFAMHEQAEFGAAAHWGYSEYKYKGNIALSGSGEYCESIGGTKISWVRELVKWQEELEDADKFLEAVKFDALSHRNFIFSPNGDVYDLPTDATPVDFACAVHTDLLWHIRSAKVNGKMVPLDRKLESGDTVEVIKSKNRTIPNKGWLDFVVTQNARRKIKSANGLT